MAVIDVVRRRAGILQDISINLQPGQEDVDLGVGSVHGLPLVTKNGVSQTIVTHYAWATYQSYLTLVTPANEGDEMFIQAQRVFTDASINDVISESQNMVVLPALRPLYDSASLLTSLTVEALIAARTVGRLRQDLAKGASLEDPKYRSGLELINEVRHILDAIRAGSMGIIGSDGLEMATREGAFVGAFIHPDGAIDGRLKAVDRAQQWHGLIQNYWPEVHPAHVGNPRGMEIV